MEHIFLKPLDTKAILDLAQYFIELFRTNPPSFLKMCKLKRTLIYVTYLISLLVNGAL